MLVPPFLSSLGGVAPGHGPSGDTGNGSGRVLVIDDDAAVREACRRNLRLAGFDVVAAESGADALVMLRADPTIRLILLDMNMPGMDGWQFRRFQAEDPRMAAIPTIVVSAAPLADLIQVPLQVTHYLRKPVSRQHLISVVADYCEPRQPW